MRLRGPSRGPRPRDGGDEDSYFGDSFAPSFRGGGGGGGGRGRDDGRRHDPVEVLEVLDLAAVPTLEEKRKTAKDRAEARRRGRQDDDDDRTRGTAASSSSCAPSSSSAASRRSANSSTSFALSPTSVLSPRADAWSYLFLSSVAAASALSSSSPPGSRTSEEEAAVALLGTAAALALCASAAFRYRPSRIWLSGPVDPTGERLGLPPCGWITPELPLALVASALWTAIAALVLRPSADVAAVAGPRDLWNPTLYYASWAAVASCGFLVADLVTAADPSGALPAAASRGASAGNAVARGWALTVPAATALLAASAELRGEVASCDAGTYGGDLPDPVAEVCATTLAGIAVGVLGLVLAAAYALAGYLEPAPPRDFRFGDGDRSLDSRSDLLGRGDRRRRAAADPPSEVPPPPTRHDKISGALSLAALAAHSANLAFVAGGGPDAPCHAYLSAWTCFALSLYLCARHVDLRLVPASRRPVPVRASSEPRWLEEGRVRVVQGGAGVGDGVSGENFKIVLHRSESAGSAAWPPSRGGGFSVDSKSDRRARARAQARAVVPVQQDAADLATLVDSHSSSGPMIFLPAGGDQGTATSDIDDDYTSAPMYGNPPQEPRRQHRWQSQQTQPWQQQQQQQQPQSQRPQRQPSAYQDSYQANQPVGTEPPDAYHIRDAQQAVRGSQGTAASSSGRGVRSSYARGTSQDPVSDVEVGGIDARTQAQPSASESDRSPDRGGGGRSSSPLGVRASAMPTYRGRGQGMESGSGTGAGTDSSAPRTANPLDRTTRSVSRSFRGQTTGAPTKPAPRPAQAPAPPFRESSTRARDQRARQMQEYVVEDVLSESDEGDFSVLPRTVEGELAEASKPRSSGESSKSRSRGGRDKRRSKSGSKGDRKSAGRSSEGLRSAGRSSSEGRRSANATPPRNLQGDPSSKKMSARSSIGQLTTSYGSEGPGGGGPPTVSASGESHGPLTDHGEEEEEEEGQRQPVRMGRLGPRGIARPEEYEIPTAQSGEEEHDRPAIVIDACPDTMSMISEPTMLGLGEGSRPLRRDMHQSDGAYASADMLRYSNAELSPASTQTNEEGNGGGGGGGNKDDRRKGAVDAMVMEALRQAHEARGAGGGRSTPDESGERVFKMLHRSKKDARRSPGPPGGGDGAPRTPGAASIHSFYSRGYQTNVDDGGAFPC